LANTAGSTAPNQELLPSIIDDLDFSLIGASNDLFDSNQGADPARSISPQYYSSVITGPSTAPPLYCSKSPNYFEEPYRRQSLSKPIPTTCDCNTQPTLSPTHFPGRRSDAGPPHQMPISQHEAPEERQNVCYQLTPAGESCNNRPRSGCAHMRCSSLSEHEQQDWQNQGMDLTDVNTPLLSLSIPAQARLPSEMRLPTPGDSASSSSTKSPPTVRAVLPATNPDSHVQNDTSNSNSAAITTTTTKTNTSTMQQSSSPSADLETRFERIFDAIEEAGFDSIDSMAASYYTARFPAGSLCAAAQSLSRRRHLRSFLEDVRDAARRWDAGESQGYQEATIKSATGVYVEELAGLRDRAAAAGCVGTGISGMGGTGGATRTDSVKRIRDAVLDEEMVKLLKDEKRLLRERVRSPSHFLYCFYSYSYSTFHTSFASSPLLSLQTSPDFFFQLTHRPIHQTPENWSFLMELARSAGLSQPESSQIVCLFLCLLMG
jgi:hypothetical protein